MKQLAWDEFRRNLSLGVLVGHGGDPWDRQLVTSHLGEVMVDGLLERRRVAGGVTLPDPSESEPATNQRQPSQIQVASRF